MGFLIQKQDFEDGGNRTLSWHKARLRTCRLHVQEAGPDPQSFRAERPDKTSASAARVEVAGALEAETL